MVSRRAQREHDHHGGRPRLLAVGLFDNEEFFPIDGQLYASQTKSHNFAFTLESHAEILYVGGETYGFTSDDDLWVFVNHRLAVDLGGVHASLNSSLDLDQSAAELGLAQGQMFALDLFYANREPPGGVLAISIPPSDLWTCPNVK